MRLGVSLPQFTDDRGRFLDGARRAEAAGLDSIWLFDHLWPLSGGKSRPILECWTALSWIAAITKDIGIGTLVTRSTLRHPVLLAKMAATVGEIAPGRLTVGIGSGDDMSREENESFGIEYLAGDARTSQLVSTAAVVVSYLSSDRVALVDAYVSIAALPSSPKPRLQTPVWLAGRSREMLESAGRLADGWNAWGADAPRFAADAGVVLAAAGERNVELTWAGSVILAEDDRSAQAKLGTRDPRGYLVGGPETVTEALRALEAAGASHAVCVFPDAGRPGTYELLAEQVAPALR